MVGELAYREWREIILNIGAESIAGALTNGGWCGGGGGGKRADSFQTKFPIVRCSERFCFFFPREKETA